MLNKLNIVISDFTLYSTHQDDFEYKAYDLGKSFRLWYRLELLDQTGHGIINRIERFKKNYLDRCNNNISVFNKKSRTFYHSIKS